MRTFALLISTLAVSSRPDSEWSRLPPLPDSRGVAGAFAGVSGGALLVAGGANFPDRPPWEGGRKVWHDRVYVLERPAGRWKVAGGLPRPLAYGVSVTFRGGLVCVGGSGPDRHFADAFRLDWDGSKLVRTPLPPLPTPLANACGAIVGDVLHVAGGQVSPNATQAARDVYRIDLSAVSPSWERVAPCPGPGRILAIAGSLDGAFWLVGGVELVAEDGQAVRRYLKDAYRYGPGRGWTRLPDLPHPVAAAPSPTATDRTGLLVLGGDDGSQVGRAPTSHTGFDRNVLRFDVRTSAWTAAGTLPAARVTVPLVRWNDLWVVPSGEARPGVRSPEVWCLSADKGE